MENKQANTGGSREVFSPEEQSLDQLVEQGAAAVAKGENPEQILEQIQGLISNKEKETARKKLSAALAKRGLRAPSTDVADIPSRRTLARLKAALSQSTRQMVDRIMLLVKFKPDVAARIKQAGQVLAKNGVRVDKVALSDVDLGTISPSVGMNTGVDRGPKSR